MANETINWLDRYFTAPQFMNEDEELVTVRPVIRVSGGATITDNAGEQRTELEIDGGTGSTLTFTGSDNVPAPHRTTVKFTGATVTENALADRLEVAFPLTEAVPVARTVNTTSPLAGGGALSADLTLSVDPGLAQQVLTTMVGEGGTSVVWATPSVPGVLTPTSPLTVTGGGDMSTDFTVAIGASSTVGQVLKTTGTGVVGWADETGGVPTARTITATTPVRIDGGNSADLSANRTLSIVAAGTSGHVLTTTNGVVGWAAPASDGVPTTRSISTTSPLTGGGNLSADRTLAITPSSTTGYVLTTTTGGTTVGWQAPQLPANGVATTRTLTGTSPIRIDGAASGDLSANRTISIDPTGTSGYVLTTNGSTVSWQAATGTPTSRLISTSGVLNGGGDLTANRTIAVTAASTAGYVLLTPDAGGGTPGTPAWASVISALPSWTTTGKAHLTNTRTEGGSNSLDWEAPLTVSATSPITATQTGANVDFKITASSTVGQVLTTTGANTVGWATNAAFPTATVKTASIISDSVATPPTDPLLGDCYKIASSPTGSWSFVGANHLVSWNGISWQDLGTLSAGDKVLVASSARPLSGSFSAYAGQYGTWSGSAWSFAAPSTGDVSVVLAPNTTDAGTTYVYGSGGWESNHAIKQVLRTAATDSTPIVFLPVEAYTLSNSAYTVTALTLEVAPCSNVTFEVQAQATLPDGSVSATICKKSTFKRFISYNAVQVGTTVDAGTMADETASGWDVDFAVSGNYVYTQVTGGADQEVLWTVSSKVTRRGTYAFLLNNFGIFEGGGTGSATAYSDKYVFWTDAVSNASSLSSVSEAGASCSSSVAGIHLEWASGCKRTFATDAVASCSGIPNGRYRFNMAACSNATVGVFSGGSDGQFRVYTDIWTFSTDAMASGTALGVGRSVLAACSNSVNGILGGGENVSKSAYTDKYTFATGNVSPGTALGVARSGLAACSNSTFGIFGCGITAGGGSVYTDVWSFGTDAVAPGNALGLARYLVAACSNLTFGIFGGGYIGSPTAYTDKVAFSSSAVAPGNVLGLARHAVAACSTAHGGL